MPNPFGGLYVYLAGNETVKLVETVRLGNHLIGNTYVYNIHSYILIEW